MKTSLLSLAGILFASLFLLPSPALAGNRIVAWGWDGYGQTDVPPDLTNVVAISAGWRHNLALKSDGTVAAWGYNDGGPTNIPAGLSGVSAIAAADGYNLVLKSNGTVVAWGANGSDLHVSGLANITAIAAGWFHWMALKPDGTFETWGGGGANYNPTNVPPGANANVRAIAAGIEFSAVLKSNGTVVAWGWNQFNQTNVPPGLTNVIAIAAGYYHTLALRADGTVVAWGSDVSGQTNVPPGLSNVVAIAAGAEHSLALKSDGTVVAWGAGTTVGPPDYGQSIVPPDLTNAFAISAGEYHSLALAGDGLLIPTVCVSTPPGLVATWRAEDNAVDSVGGYAGSEENVSYAPGKVGQTFVFNPSLGTTRISVPDQPAFALTNSLTIEGWIRPTGPGGWTIFWRGDNRGGYDPYFIQLNPDDGNTLQFVIEQETPNTPVVLETAPLAYNEWCHVAATLDGGTGEMAIYTNGVLALHTTTAIRPFANLNSGADASIGIGNVGEHSFDHPFVGDIDEISLYNRALSQPEIQGIYSAGSAGKCAPEVCADYPDFNSIAGLNLVGSAAVTSGTLRLTPAVDSQTGDAWLLAKQPCAGGFDTSFHFRITDLGNIYGNEPGGDGLTFAIQNLGPTNLSWAMGDTNEFVAVFFNTFWNWPGCTCPDVSGNSVGILVNQTYVAQTDLNPFGIDMSDGAVHSARVLYDGGAFSVWVDGALVLTNVPLAGLNPGVDANGNGWVGFTAGTGAAYENHDILDWSFCAGAGAPPHLSAIGNQEIHYSQSAGPLPFTVADAQWPADSLMVTAASSNTNLITADQIVFGGAGSNRTVTLTPISNQLGTAVITLTATNPAGGFDSTAFQLNVVNSSPVVSGIPSQHLASNASSAPLAFTIWDYETPAGELLVTASSSNTNFIPNAGLVLGGLGTNRTITVTPASNQVGVATITVRVGDPFVTNQTSFSVTVDQFNRITLPTVPILNFGAVAWGDFDNDGWLDLVTTGTSNNFAAGAATLIYRNDHGVLTNILRLPGVYRSAVAWSDFDRDGWLDLTVSGLNSLNVPVAIIYRNNHDGTFTDIHAGLTGEWSGLIAWGDYDNDGAPDLFLSGIGGTNTALVGMATTNISRLYHNDGSGKFMEVDTHLPAASLGSAAWADYDNDGRPDLLVVGSSNYSGFAAIYRNLGNGQFAVGYNFSQASSYRGGSAAWGDWNNDGRLDVAIGINGGAQYIFQNNGNGTFTARQTISIGNPTASVHWGDFDNDGLLDLLIAGEFNGQLYRNTNGGFALMPVALPSAFNGAVGLADVDNDGDLDILFMSKAPTLLRNESGKTNSLPITPFVIGATTGLTNSVALNWNRSLDFETPTNGLSYNLRVGTTLGGTDIVSPLADATNGQRRVVALGNVGQTNRATLVNLPKGTYYWSVQAIDTAFAGSPFAPGITTIHYSFVITNARPVISAIPDIAISPGTNPPAAVLPFTIGDAETWAGSLKLTVRSSNTNVVPTNNIVIVRGVPGNNYPSNCTVRVTSRTNGVSLITITVTDAQGAFASSSFKVTTEPFNVVPNTFVQVQNSFVAWGDYNNDGRLDVLIGGATNGSAFYPFPPYMQPATQLYRNDGNGVFTPVPSGMPNLTHGAAAWGDFDNDAYLDLLVTGTTNNSYTGALSRIYRNNHDGTFTDIGAGLPGVYSSAVAWGDFDNDGRSDLVLAGLTNSSSAITRIYHNNGDGTFTAADMPLPGISSGSVAWSDLDGDGDLDLVVAGNYSYTSAGGGIFQAFRNNGNGTFTPTSNLTGVANGSLAIGDYDNDGRPDILLSGLSSGGPRTMIYHNNGNFNFSSVASGIENASTASVAWGDFDNDGRLDILISGNLIGGTLPPTYGGFTRVYRNTSSTVGGPLFTNFPVNLPTNYFGAATWADFDNDGRLDFLLTGTDGVYDRLRTPRSQTFLFHNNASLPNTPPTAPTALTSIRSNNMVALSWAGARDAETQTILMRGLVTNYAGLKYQIRVGTVPGGFDIESPGSDLSNGFRRIVQTGDASTNRWQLAHLPPGTYCWSVQAIDTAFAGSPFSAESSFVVTHPPIAVADAISTATNIPAIFPASKLALNDTDADGDPLAIIGVSNPSAAGGNVALVLGQVTYVPPPDFSGNDWFTYTVSDGQGGVATGNVMVTVGSGGSVALNIVFGPVVAGGNFVVSFAGIPGLTYTVEAAPTLAGPWSKVANRTAPDTDLGLGVGVFTFTEPVNGNSTRFYRTVFPAY